MTATLIILVLTATLLVWGKIRSDVIALCSMLALVLTGVITPADGLAGFSNPVVIMIAGLFIVGGAISRTGIATKVSKKVLSLAGDNSTKLWLLVMFVTTIVALFVSNTGTVAILMPIVMSIAHQSNTHPSRLLMPMAFLCSIGGMMTLIGTPPILIAHNALVESGEAGLKFFSTLPVGLVLFVIAIAMLLPLSKLLEKKSGDSSHTGKSNVKTPDQLSNEYQIIDNLYRLELKKDSPLIGRKLVELELTKEYGCTIAEIHRRNTSRLGKVVTAHLPEAKSIIGEHDVLYTLGNYENVRKLADEMGLTFMDANEVEGIKPKFSGKFKFNQFGFAEVVLLHGSRLNDKMVKKTDLRKNYNINILAIQRNDKYILKDIPSFRLHAGDMLLVQGTWEDIDKMNRLENDIVVIGQPVDEASKVTLDHKSPIALGIILLMVLSMVFNWLPPVISVLLAAISLILSGCFRSVKEAYETINWESIILFASMIPLSTAMENTGLSSIVSGNIVDTLGPMGTYAVMAGLMVGTSLLTMFISNTATAILFAPIALQAANALGVSSYPFLIGVAVAASMCFASPFSTPPNAMVMSAGRYSFTDYLKVGLPLQLVILLVMIFVIPLIFPF